MVSLVFLVSEGKGQGPKKVTNITRGILAGVNLRWSGWKAVVSGGWGVALDGNTVSNNSSTILICLWKKYFSKWYFNSEK